MGRERARKAIYTFAGVYLIYLAYTMGRDWNQIPDKERIFVGIAVAAFVLIGAGLTVWGVKGVLNPPGQQPETDGPETDGPKTDRQGTDGPKTDRQETDGQETDGKREAGEKTALGTEPLPEEAGSKEKTKEVEEKE